MNQTHAKRQKSRFGGLIKILISVALIGAIYYTIDRRALWKTLSGIHWQTAATLILLYSFGQILSALKWRIFVQEAGLPSSKRNLFRAYLFGMFINVFGFGTVGGDIARALALKPKKGQRAAALATVVADRIHGLAILSFIAVVSMAIVWPKELGVFTSFLFLGGLCSIALLAALWWLGPAVITRLMPNGHKWADPIQRLLAAFPRRSAPLIQASLISMVFHTVQIFMHVIIARELAAALSTGYIFATVPFANIISSLPISVMNGLGVREGMYILLFSPAGISKEVATAFGAIWLGTITFVSSIGILFSTPGLDPAHLSDGEQELKDQAEKSSESTVGAGSASEPREDQRAWG